MAKRRTDRDADSLPLFDLPLREGAEDGTEDDDELEHRGGPTSLGEPDEPPRRPAPAPVETPGLPFPEADDDHDDDASEADDEGGDRETPPPGIGGRLLAGAVDLLAQVAAVGIAAAVTHGLGVPLDADDAASFAVLALAFSFLYWVVPLAFWGQTPGMTVCGHLARTRDDEPLTFSQTARRWLGALLTLALAALPLLLAATGRSLTDRLSGTKTVRL